MLAENFIFCAIGPLLSLKVFRDAVLMQALKFCKEKNIKHNDLKPANILLNTSGQIKLADFGESYLLNEHQNDVIKGSIAYCSPEKFAGYEIDSEKDDIWSLGIILGELMYGCDFLTILSGLGDTATLLEWKDFILKYQIKINSRFKVFFKYPGLNWLPKCFLPIEKRINYQDLEALTKKNCNVDTLSYYQRLLFGKYLSRSIKDDRPFNLISSFLKFPYDNNLYKFSYKKVMFIDRKIKPREEEFRCFHFKSRKMVSFYGIHLIADLKKIEKLFSSWQNHPNILPFYGICYTSIICGHYFDYFICTEPIDICVEKLLEKILNHLNYIPPDSYEKFLYKDTYVLSEEIIAYISECTLNAINWMHSKGYQII